MSESAVTLTYREVNEILRGGSARVMDIPGRGVAFTCDLVPEIAEWCADNLENPVIPMHAAMTDWKLVFGCDTDHVAFKLRWL